MGREARLSNNALYARLEKMKAVIEQRDMANVANEATINALRRTLNEERDKCDSLYRSLMDRQKYPLHYFWLVLRNRALSAFRA